MGPFALTILISFCVYGAGDWIQGVQYPLAIIFNANVMFLCIFPKPSKWSYLGDCLLLLSDGNLHHQSGFGRALWTHLESWTSDGSDGHSQRRLQKGHPLDP